MQFAVRSGPESRLIVAGNTLIAAGHTRIGSGNIMIGPWDSLANSEYFEQGRKREQQKTNQPIGIRFDESKSLHERSCYTHTKTPTESISAAQLETGLRCGFSTPFHRETIGRWRHHRNPRALSENLHEIGIPKKNNPWLRPQGLILYLTGHMSVFHAPTDTLYARELRGPSNDSDDVSAPKPTLRPSIPTRTIINSRPT